MFISQWYFTRIKSLCYGLTLPYKALRLILAHPTLMAWSLLPISITLALYVFVVQKIQLLAQNSLQNFFQSFEWNPEGMGAFFVLLFFKILIFLASAMTFSIVASIIASPFNDFLAETSEKWATPPLPTVPPQDFKLKIKLIGIDVGKSMAALLATLFAIFISWIPGINVVAMIVAFLLVTFQYISYPQTRRSINLSEGAKFLWRYFYACSGFGATLSLCFAIPILASLCVPLAVVGGTLLVARAQPTHDQFPLK